MATPERLVHFEKPPVAEVALSVQFANPVIDDPTVVLGNFWPQVRGQYEKIEVQPPLPPMDETFEVPAKPRLAFQIVGGGEQNQNRYLLVSADDTELLQVQPNRFGYNWRKPPPSNVEYPRYPHVREHFESAYSAFVDTVSALGKAPEPSWCEIVYVNPIDSAPGEARPDLSSILRRIDRQELSVLPRPFNTQFAERFQLERDGKPFARFYIEVEPSFTENNALGYQLSLMMRGQPATRDSDGVLAFFDEGRNKIVNAFRAITTDEMHERWGLA